MHFVCRCDNYPPHFATVLISFVSSAIISLCFKLVIVHFVRSVIITHSFACGITTHFVCRYENYPPPMMSSPMHRVLLSAAICPIISLLFLALIQISDTCLQASLYSWLLQLCTWHPRATLLCWRKWLATANAMENGWACGQRHFQWLEQCPKLVGVSPQISRPVIWPSKFEQARSTGPSTCKMFSLGLDSGFGLLASSAS